MLEDVPTKVDKNTVCIDFLLTGPERRFGKPKLAGRAGFDKHTPIRAKIVVEIAMSD